MSLKMFKNKDNNKLTKDKEAIFERLNGKMTIRLSITVTKKTSTLLFRSFDHGFYPFIFWYKRHLYPPCIMN